ncbi:hypothetical protein F5887DRAFT_971204 [Amanita rubescens]|nr:hypothetical protein F5887DRAFT_971204 [Amanita rubescens]
MEALSFSPIWSSSGFRYFPLWALFRAVKAIKATRVPRCFFRQGTMLWELIFQLGECSDRSREWFFKRSQYGTKI